MGARQTTAETGLGFSFTISTVIHLAVFLLALWWGRFSSDSIPLQETYYVDVVNLPAADPRAGSPTQKGNDAEQAPPPRGAEDSMTPPSAPEAGAKGNTGKTTIKGEPESSAFAERMARLESKSEAQQAEAALQALQKRVKSTGSGRSGMPAGSGKEEGSDYTAYIQSRLSDAFRETISYSSKSPEMVVRLFIDADGKLSRKRTERSSDDRAFEIAVLRAIDLASEKFTPPPGRKGFEGVFVFRPQGITQNRPKTN